MCGEKWQDLALTVSTDEGPRTATRFFVNGEEPVRRVVAEGGYTISARSHTNQGRRAVDGESGFGRLSEIAPSDVIPMQLNTLVGTANTVGLPVLDQA